MKFNARQRMNGLRLLEQLPARRTKLVFFDPQYRALLDKLKFGNEGERQADRHALPAMTDIKISVFMHLIRRVIRPSGHLMLWVDKYTLGTGHFMQWLEAAPDMRLVDIIVWDKERIGMGRRSRARSEYLLVIQRPPIKALGIWRDHGIPDNWHEKVGRAAHPHTKPHRLQRALIECLTDKGDLVVDPAAGGYSVMKAALSCKREFVGCDLR